MIAAHRFPALVLTTCKLEQAVKHRQALHTCGLPRDCVLPRGPWYVAVGFLLCLDKVDYPNAALLKRPELTYQFEVQGATYFKTARMRELDEVCFQW